MRRAADLLRNLGGGLVGGISLARGWGVFRSLAGNQALARVVGGYVLFTLTQYSVWVAMLVYAYRQGGAAVAGLVAVTPASGFVLPSGALVIGIAAGIICFFAATTVKNALGYDDSLDAFGVHAVGGIVGAVLTGVFATMVVTGAKDPVGLIDGNPGQILTQLVGIATTIVYCGIVTLIILKVVDAIVGLRVSEEVERDGLDVGLHGESLL